MAQAINGWKNGRWTKPKRNIVKEAVTLFKIEHKNWEQIAGDRAEWRRTIQDGVTHFQVQRALAVEKTNKRGATEYHRNQCAYLLSLWTGVWGWDWTSQSLGGELCTIVNRGLETLVNGGSTSNSAVFAPR